MPSLRHCPSGWLLTALRSAGWEPAPGAVSVMKGRWALEMFRTGRESGICPVHTLPGLRQVTSSLRTCVSSSVKWGSYCLPDRASRLVSGSVNYISRPHTLASQLRLSQKWLGCSGPCYALEQPHLRDSPNSPGPQP